MHGLSTGELSEVYGGGCGGREQNSSVCYYAEEFKETNITLKYVQILKMVLEYIQAKSRR